MSFDGDLYPTAGATSVMTTKGDMVDYDTVRQRLGIGSANQVLSVTAGLPAWKTLTLADSVLTTAGDVLYENNTPELARLPKGSDDDVLTLASGLPSWAAPAGGGGWTSEGTATQTTDTELTLDLTLNNAFDEDKAVLYVTGNGSSTNTTGNDWWIGINDSTAADYSRSTIQLLDGTTVSYESSSGETKWALSNQYNPTWNSWQMFLYITKVAPDESDELWVNGSFNFQGTSNDYSYYGNTRTGTIWRQGTEVTSITKLNMLLGGSGATKMQIGTTMSAWSLAKS